MTKDKIKDLVKNKAEHIRLKKAQLKTADPFAFNSKIAASKTFQNKGIKDDTEDMIYRTIVGNTYYWMDSYDDVHIKGCFTKSIQENEKSIMHLHDHVYQLVAKVGVPMSIYEAELSWSELGVERSGMTTALCMDSQIRKDYNAMIFNEYKSGAINQHSVGMRYVNIQLAVNDSEYKEEFATWNKYINLLGNMDKALEEGYFWAVTEAKLYEISAVIRGANEITPTLNSNKADINQIKSLLDTYAATLPNEQLQKNFSHICNQFKALIENEPLDLTLEETKPQKNEANKNHLFYPIL